MRDGSVTSGTATLFWAHGGAREPKETIAPSYEAERQPQTFSTLANSVLAPWIAHERYAPPGPGLAYLPTLRLVLPLFGAVASYQTAPPKLPEALLDEPTVLQRIADLVEEETPDPGPTTEPDDRVDLAEREFPEEAIPDDWLPSEPTAPALELLPPPYWGTTTDPARNAELHEGHGTAAERPPLPSLENQAPAPSPPSHKQAGILSWLDRSLRQQEAPQPDLSAEPPLRPFPAPETAPAEIPVVHAPKESPAEPQQVAPAQSPIALQEPTDTPGMVEPPRESRIEPQLLTPEPPPQPIVPQPLVERPMVADGPRPRRIEKRLPQRLHLPSLFTPSAKAPPAPAVDGAPRSRRFGWRMRRLSPVLPTTALPANAPVAARTTEARGVQPSVPREPTPPIDVTPLPSLVDEAQDPPVQAAPEPPARLPAHDLPPPATLPQPEAPDEPVQPARTAAYWAEPTWIKSAQTAPDQPESLAWTPPPAPLAGPPRARRSMPAMEGLWAAEPVGASDAGSDAQPGAGRRIARRVATVGAGVAVLAAACVAVLHFLPRAFVSNLVPAATFNAPMMVLRANGPGRVVGIAVQNGQTVDPNTLLLTIRTEPQPDPTAALLRARLDAAQARLSELDQSLAQATPTTEAGRARIADLRRQRASAVIDVAQLKDGVTNIPAAKPADLPVKAGIHGVIRSLEARTGTITAAGVPLVRMLDCDHAFLTVAPESKLRAGQAVQVRLPNLPPVAATVRQSTGIAEPPDSLVIATPPGAFIGQLSGSCPIGATATVTPSITGS